VKRLVCLFWLLLALAPVVLVAQSSRLSCAGASCSGANALAVVIETPTESQNHQTDEATLILAGRARNDVTRVDWSNDRGGSGTATGTFPIWTVEAGGGGEPETVMQDTFTIEVATNLVDHTPGPTGLLWFEAEDTLGNNHAKLNTTSDYVSPALTTSTGKLIVIATPATPVSGDHYTVSMKTGPNYSVSSGTDSALIFGWVDVNNYCALVIRSSTQNPDLILMKRVAGVNTDLTPGVDVTPLAGHVFALEVDGTALTVQRNGSTVLSATDSAGACDNSTDAGIGWGDIRTPGRTINQVASFDDFTIVDEDSAATGITLQSGANVITVTAYCGVSSCGTDVITVTKGVTDTVDPQVVITGPTAGSPYPTSQAAITVSGTSSDNVGVVSVGWSCPTATPASGTATLAPADSSWTFNTTLAAGATTCTVTATDAAARTGVDSFVINYTAADVTPPTVAIDTPTAGASHTASDTPLTLGGTFSDNVAVIQITCANSAGGGTVNATGSGVSGRWSCPVGLFNTGQTITVTAVDQATNTATDTLTVSFSPTVTITSNAGLPAAGQNVAYSVTLAVSGGTSPFTWDNNSGGSSLGGAACTGLSISAAGVVSGTPTTTGTCSFTSKVTDNVAASDTQAHTILVSAIATGQHAYFEALRLRPDWWKGYSLRPQAGVTSATNPYYEKQLNAANNGGLHAKDCVPATADARAIYDYANDTDPHRQDAAKVNIPSFQQVGTCEGHTLTAPLSASAAGAADVVFLTDTTSTYQSLNTRQLLIDNEIMKFRICTAAEGGTYPTGAYWRVDAQNKLCVTRGEYGTTAAAHSIGAVAKLSGNALVNYLEPHIDSVDGYTYLITWDAYFTDSYLKFSWDQGSKSFQITQGSGNDNKEFEPKVRYDCRNGANVQVVGCTKGQQVGAVAARIYNSFNPASGPSVWSETNGNLVYPGEFTSVSADAYPQDGNFIIRANVWTRWWIRVRQKANDFDVLSMWVADENTEPSLIFDEVRISVSGTLDPARQEMDKFQFALGNSSTEFKRGFDASGNLFDFISYFRNWAVLRWTHAAEPADLAAEGLMAKPIGSGGGS
jgi:hypothetical protein